MDRQTQYSGQPASTWKTAETAMKRRVRSASVTPYAPAWRSNASVYVSPGSTATTSSSSPSAVSGITAYPRSACSPRIASG